MGEKINYILKKSARARRARITVRAGGEVTVIVPRRMSEDEAHRLVVLKSDWILQKVNIWKNIKPVIVTSGSRREFYAYRARAKQLVMKKINAINAIYGFTFKRVSIKYQKTRWGSCSRARNLNFNYRIVFLPEHLADYLVAHELCHLKELNHSARFWALVGKAAPDYKKHTRELRGVI